MLIPIRKAREPMTTTAAQLLASPVRIWIGGLPIVQLDKVQTAELMLSVARERERVGPPPLFTSANGEVLSRCASSPSVARLFANAAVISADGQPLVLASRLLTEVPIPERVATTDLFHDVAARAERGNMTFAIFGATPAENRKALAAVRNSYPALRIVAESHGFIDAAGEAAFVDRVAALRPDVLWVCLGIPREQAFYDRWKDKLASVGIVKTGGGLLNFLSGTNTRAPVAMQRLGFEWLYRIMLEPRRLFWRYALTNPHALYLMATRSGAVWPRRGVTP
jgi:N-acetylglucosaminyldiphosphoundecaprenol N-acetyl-beta-D-mannosaminyltransferase